MTNGLNVGNRTSIEQRNSHNLGPINTFSHSNTKATNGSNPRPLLPQFLDNQLVATQGAAEQDGLFNEYYRE